MHLDLSKHYVARHEKVGEQSSKPSLKGSTVVIIWLQTLEISNIEALKDIGVREVPTFLLADRCFQARALDSMVKRVFWQGEQQTHGAR